MLPATKTRYRAIGDTAALTSLFAQYRGSPTASGPSKISTDGAAAVPIFSFAKYIGSPIRSPTRLQSAELTQLLFLNSHLSRFSPNTTITHANKRTQQSAIAHHSADHFLFTSPPLPQYRLSNVTPALAQTRPHLQPRCQSCF